MIIIKRLISYILCSVLLITMVASPCYSFSSQQAYENYVKTTDPIIKSDGTAHIEYLNSCYDLKKIPFYDELQNLYHVTMAGTVAENAVLNANDALIIDGIIASIYALLAVNAGLLATLANPISIIALSVEIAILLDVCTNYYIIQPYEYINYLSGIVPTATNAVNEFKAPYYFQCTQPGKYGYSSLCKGYSSSSNTCSSAISSWQQPRDIPSLPSDIPSYCFAQDIYYPYATPGTVMLGYDGPLMGDKGRLTTSRPGPYQPRRIYQFNPSVGFGSTDPARAQGVGAAYLMSYYRMNSQYPLRFEACIISVYTMLPVLIGCAPVAPPAEVGGLDSNLGIALQGNRCQYISEPRADLNSLGYALNTSYNPGDGAHDGTSVIRFLKSNLHISSTVVGCIKDMANSLFVLSSSSQPSFLQAVQGNLSGVIKTVLVLYIILVAIKIMAPAQELEMKDYVLLFVKFSIVVGLTNYSLWGTISNFMVNAGDEIGSIFMSSLSANDALGRCSYIYESGELLSERLITNTEAVPTYGQKGVLLTVWDMFDCKLLNYLNLGSCDYTFVGMLGPLLLGTSMLFNTAGPVAYVSFMFACLMCGYLYIILSIFWKVARISILVTLVLCCLMVTSPIFILFWLFDQTSDIFKKWCHYLLGYALYPGLLLGFISLIVITLDGIYYGFSKGDIQAATGTYEISGNPISSTGSPPNSVLMTICNNNVSLFCSTVKKMGGDPCASDMSAFNKAFLGIYGGLGFDMLLLYMQALIRMTLFCLLFYFLTESTITMISSLLGVSGMESIASSGVLNMLIKGVQDKMKAKRNDK